MSQSLSYQSCQQCSDINWKTLVYLNSRGRVGRLDAGLQKTRLQSKMAAEIDVFRVSPQQNHIAQTLSYIYHNEIFHETLETNQVTIQNITLCPVMNFAELFEVQFC